VAKLWKCPEFQRDRLEAMLHELLALPVKVTLCRGLGLGLHLSVLCISTMNPRTGEWSALMFVPTSFLATCDLSAPTWRQHFQVQVGAQIQALARQAC